MVRVLLEPWGDGVRPHEHTMPGPKADRLSLLRATRTQLSPILAVYFDRIRAVSASHEPGLDRRVRGRATPTAFSTSWRAVEPDDRLIGHLGRQTLFVADGHHRYETALAYQAGGPRRAVDRVRGRRRASRPTGS